MNKELEQRFFRRWPTWFDSTGHTRWNPMARGFENVGDGWFRVLWKLCEDIEPIVAGAEESGERFQILQVKEKLGTLRFYVNIAREAILDRADAARYESSRTCDLCGTPGQQRDEGGWIIVRCEEHTGRR
jgi:hypothetical protein